VPYGAVNLAMNDALIGEEVTLEAAPGADLATLVVSAATAFLAAAAGVASRTETVDGGLHGYVAGYAPGVEQVLARLVVVRDGVEVHLSAADHADTVRTVKWPG